METDLSINIVNCIRSLSIDAVEKAQSGHPGTPMALAPVAFKLWDEFIRHNPANPSWHARDRFVLSAGHASMLLYSILHISGYEISIEDIKNFRRLGGKCAGHPEYGLTGGIETTTGPLGQGAATSVGMASAGKWLSNRFDKPGFDLAGFNVFSILSDGDMMEGVTSEAASLAAHLNLCNLVWIYDDNRITIDGGTDISFSENVPERFASYGWDIFHVEDANELSALESAYTQAIKSRAPALVRVKSRIGFGSPGKENTPEAHGAPLGKEEANLAKKSYGLGTTEEFHTPEEVLRYRLSVIEKGKKLEEEWEAKLEKYSEKYPDLASEFRAISEGSLPEGWADGLPAFEPGSNIATRVSNGKIMEDISRKIPWFIGGAADVSDSTKTNIKSAGYFSARDRGGRNFHFGVREHSMAAFCNGLALCGLRPYASCYFVFSDYMKPALRLSALMRQPVVYIFSHDSIGVGEDGPTHQPIEHLATLRATPGIDVVRPADGNELSALWHEIIEARRPAAVVLTRQNVTTLETHDTGKGARLGAYVAADGGGEPEIIIIATGSEVYPCIEAHKMLAEKGIISRVVSMPSWEIFDRQPVEYKDFVLPPNVKKRLSVEAASTLGWERYTGGGEESLSLGVDRFGVSAPSADAMKEFGFDGKNIFSIAKKLVGK